MEAEHRVKVYAVRYIADGGASVWLWYCPCTCGWEPGIATYHPVLARDTYGRPAWDVAFALALTHLKEHR